jgi:hypothetical protein
VIFVQGGLEFDTDLDAWVRCPICSAQLPLMLDAHPQTDKEFAWVWEHVAWPMIEAARRECAYAQSGGH